MPNGLDSVEGDTSAIGLFGGSPRRTQVIYAGRNFTSIPKGGVFITALQFRIDGQYQTGFSGAADLEIHLSTSLQNPDLLNPLFASNIGSDERITLPRSTIPLSSGANPGGLNSFSVIIPLPTHFFFDPSVGNLLMDAFVYADSGVLNLDWQSGPSDGVSAMVGSLTNPTATTVTQAGLVTRFVFEPVPEPPINLLVIGSLIAWIKWRRNVIT